MKMKHLPILVVQLLFLIVVGILLYYFYPHVDPTINGNIILFNSDNSDTIIFSKNPDFSNPKYVYFEDGKDVYVQLEPGIYYWKSSNNKLSGFENKIVILSESSLIIDRNNDTVLENVGNVKLHVTKNEAGIMVGHIILESDEHTKIADSGVYEGRQIE